MAPKVSKEISFEVLDTYGLGAKISFGTSWVVDEQSAMLVISSDDTYGNPSITSITYDKKELNAPDAVSDLIMGVSPITIQIEIDLDNGGSWTARGKWGTSDWVDLTQNGASMFGISAIKISTSFENGGISWGTLIHY